CPVPSAATDIRTRRERWCVRTRAHILMRVSESEVPEVLWQPDPAAVADTTIERFRTWLGDQRGVRVGDYHELWHYSTTSVADFWGALADFLGVIWHDLPEHVLSGPD